MKFKQNLKILGIYSKNLNLKTMDQTKKIIGFQGSNGSFSNIVSIEFQKSFPDYQIKSFLSFAQVLDNLINKNIQYAVLPVKNKIVGEITDAVLAIDNVKDKITIVRTIQLPIAFCLGAKNSTRIEEITEVYSQDHALNQCNEFFKQHPHLKRIEEIDTAIAAGKIAQSSEKIAAICSELACELNNLNVLAFNFQDNKQNYTIFNVIKLKNR